MLGEDLYFTYMDFLFIFGDALSYFISFMFNTIVVLLDWFVVNLNIIEIETKIWLKSCTHFKYQTN